MKEMPRPKLMVGGFVDFDFCSGDQDKKEGDRSSSSRGAVSMRRFYHRVGQGKKRKPRRFRRGPGIGALLLFLESLHTLLKWRIVRVIRIHNPPGGNVASFMPYRAQCFSVRRVPVGIYVLNRSAGHFARVGT